MSALEDANPAGLSVRERRRLQQRVMDILQADADAQVGLERFLPLSAHTTLLHPDKLLVVGERGTGKTALFEFLQELESRQLRWEDVAPDGQAEHLPATHWVSGYGTGRVHPSPELLSPDLLEDAALRWWWVGHLVQRVRASGVLQGLGEVPEPVAMLAGLPPDDILQVSRMAAASGGPLLRWLERVDDILRHQGIHLMVAYDYLDRIGGGANRLSTPARYSAALCALWTDLRSRLRHLHGKIFIRQDLLQQAALLRVDGGKWLGRAEHLSWSSVDLYRVLLRHLSADEEIRAWLEQGPDTIRLSWHATLGWLPPQALPEIAQLSLFSSGEAWKETLHEPDQISLARKLAGETMGKGVKKGYTHRWMMNHIQDGHARMVPRSLLNLIREAARSALERTAPEPPGGQLFWPTDLERAKAPTGQIRLTELQAEHPVVARMNVLREGLAPFSPNEVAEQLSRPGPDMDPRAWDADQLGTKGEEAVKQLAEIGVFYWRTTRNKVKILDVPELFRSALEIRRRGGVHR